MRQRKPIADRFWAKVEKGEGCWLWTGARGEAGYGAFQVTVGHRVSRLERAHRVAWVLTYGPLRDSDLVCHHCDNPPCVRPSHLFVGDQIANRRDAAVKGRIPSPHWMHKGGERNSNARLTEADIVEIRRLYFEDGLYQREIGERYGMAQAQISAIVRRKTWRHVIP